MRLIGNIYIDLYFVKYVHYVMYRYECAVVNTNIIYFPLFHMCKKLLVPNSAKYISICTLCFESDSMPVENNRI